MRGKVEFCLVSGPCITMVVLLVSSWTSMILGGETQCYISGLYKLKDAVPGKTFEEIKGKLGDIDNSCLHMVRMDSVEVLNILVEYKFSIASQSQDSGMIVWTLVKNEWI